ncbi:EboA domain-containing protein [Algoriphagus sp.]|uniref:EboA domain-containing protein n=1 Tax=Algoriphagus sp. TaxID=1872435 RepID=UPI0027280DFA|nr:EboA domain-containing protein [Algoriphagus sp.]MDO8967926.1 EboA domain-containing protein [Algoriphagus sp.]MDP3200601.1 EboA domain-containing protein [Algoriphagus sp.]
MASDIEIKSFLRKIIENRAEEKSSSWLGQKAEQTESSSSNSTFFLAFSQASRFFKKENLELSTEEKDQARNLAPGFDPSHWDLLQTARTCLLLHFPQEKEKWFTAINQLFETGDMYEQQALYAALPVMPFQEELLSRAIDGCRTNMTLIFDAIALNNPFPAKYFPEANWNQLVLKSIFMQRPLYRIQRLDERRNPALADIASDFAHERWAAGRDVMPELWRLVVPFINEKFVADLKKVLASNAQLEVEAGLLALYGCESEVAKQLLQGHNEEVMAIEYGEITWEKIGRDFQEKKA